MRLAVAVVLSCFLFAGCFAQAPGEVADEGNATMEPSTESWVAAISSCPVNCWEPAIAIDARGNIFVVTAHEPLLSVSRDGGRSYVTHPTPAAPPGAPPGVRQFDGTVAVGPDGRLYYYAFLAPSTGTFLPGPPVGLQVAASSDAAETWETNSFLSLLDSVDEPVVSPWKSWLGFGADGTVYLNYNSRGTGLWSVRSDDGAETWTAFRRVQEPTDRVISVFMGPPVVDSAGRLYIPYFTDQSPNYPNPFLPRGHELRVAVSDDRGATFSQRVVERAAWPDYVGSYFPVLALDEDDRLVIAHWGPDNRVHVRASFDRAESWTPPVVWGPDHDAFAGPWVAVRDGVVSMLTYDSQGMGYARGSVRNATLEAPEERGTLVDVVSGGGDFVHFAFDRSGRMVVPVPDADKRTVFVVFGPPVV